MAINVTTQNPTAAVNVDASISSKKVDVVQASAHGGVDVSVMGGNGSINMWQPGVSIHVTSERPLVGLHRWMTGNERYLPASDFPAEYAVGPATTVECCCAKRGEDNTEGNILYIAGSESLLIDFTSALLVRINNSTKYYIKSIRNDMPVVVKITPAGACYVDGVLTFQGATRQTTAAFSLFDPRKANTLYWLKLYEADVLTHHLLPATDFEGTPCIWDKVKKRLIYPPDGRLTVGDD